MKDVLRGLALVAKEQSTDDETCRFHAPLVRTKSRRFQPFRRYSHRAATCNDNVTVAIQPLVTSTIQSPIGELHQQRCSTFCRNILSKNCSFFANQSYSTEQAMNMVMDIVTVTARSK